MVTLISIYVLRCIGYLGIITFFPLLLVSTMGADSRTAGSLMSVYFILGTICKPTLGTPYDHFGVRLLLAMLFFVGAGVSVAVAGVTALPVMIVLMALLGMVSFISPILMTAATSLVDRSVRTSTVGMIYTAHELQFLSPVIGGVDSSAVLSARLLHVFCSRPCSGRRRIPPAARKAHPQASGDLISSPIPLFPRVILSAFVSVTLA